MPSRAVLPTRYHRDMCQLLNVSRSTCVPRLAQRAIDLDRYHRNCTPPAQTPTSSFAEVSHPLGKRTQSRISGNPLAPVGTFCEFSCALNYEMLQALKLRLEPVRSFCYESTHEAMPCQWE